MYFNDAENEAVEKRETRKKEILRKRELIEGNGG